MGQRNTSLTVALSVSLIAHGLGLSGLAWWYIRHNDHPKTEPIDKYFVMANRIYQEQKKSPPPPTPPPQHEAAKKPPPPPPIKEKFQKPKDQLKDDSGEANGTGIANRSTEGDKPMQAEAGAEQADLMKMAEHFADVFLPASAGKERGNDAEPQKSPRQGTYTPENIPRTNSSNQRSDKVVAMNTPGPGPKPKTPEVKTASAPPVSGARNPVDNVPLAQAATPKPLDREIVGHRATVSDTESVALSSTNGGIFRAGRMVGRKGLHVQTKQAIYGDASYNDAEIIGDVPTLFAVPVDADGKVRDVQIVQSCGSEHIDQDRKNALWQWTLEPAKDKDGRVIDNIWMVCFE